MKLKRIFAALLAGAALLALVGCGTSGSTGMDENDLLMWILMNQLKNQTGGSGIPDIFNTGASQTQKPADNRYYLTVVLTYDESLIQAEQARKGLDRDAKVEKVEVSE